MRWRTPALAPAQRVALGSRVWLIYAPFRGCSRGLNPVSICPDGSVLAVPLPNYSRSNLRRGSN